MSWGHHIVGDVVEAYRVRRASSRSAAHTGRSCALGGNCPYHRAAPATFLHQVAQARAMILCGSTKLLCSSMAPDAVGIPSVVTAQNCPCLHDGLRPTHPGTWQSVRGGYCRNRGSSPPADLSDLTPVPCKKALMTPAAEPVHGIHNETLRFSAITSLLINFRRCSKYSGSGLIFG